LQFFAVSLVAQASCDTAEAEYIKALKNARKQYVSRVVGSLLKFDRVEVLQTDGQAILFAPDDGSETIDLGVNAERSKIVSKKDLDKPSSKALVKALIKQLASDPTTQNNCYNPPHVGVRIYKGDKMIFESVVSIGGGTYLLKYPSHHIWADSSESLRKLIKAQQDKMRR
jgi:hypothetical protein